MTNQSNNNNNTMTTTATETDVTSAEQHRLLHHKQFAASSKQQPSTATSADYVNSFSSSDFLHKVTIDYLDDSKSSFVYRIEILVGQFKPKDFKIKLKENVLTLSGNRLIESSSSSSSNGGNGNGSDNLYNSAAPGYSSKLKQTEQFKRIINLPEFIETKTATCYLETYEKAPNVLKIEARIKKSYNAFVENLLKAKPDCLTTTSSSAGGKKAAGLPSSQQFSNDYSSTSPDKKRDSLRSNHQRSIDAAEVAARNATDYANASGVYSGQTGRFPPSKKFVNADNRINISSYGNGPVSQSQVASGKVRSQSLKSLERGARGGVPVESSDNGGVLYGSGVLKYKFDLKNFESKNISITIRKNNVLTIKAFNDSYDSYGRVYNEFSREIILPDNAEVHNIRNCFDEYDGVLRIEVPLKTSKFRSTHQLASAASGGGQYHRGVDTSDDSDMNQQYQQAVSASHSQGNLNLYETYHGSAPGPGSSSSQIRPPANNPNTYYESSIAPPPPRSASSSAKYTTAPPLSRPTHQSSYSSLNQPTVADEFYDNPSTSHYLAQNYSNIDHQTPAKSEIGGNGNMMSVENDDKTCNLNDSIKNLPEYTNDKYLELIFDLTGYKFQNTNIILNKSLQKVLIIKAFKYVEVPSASTEPPTQGAASADQQSSASSQQQTANSGNIVRKLFIRKYILPDWIDSEHIKIIKNDDEQQSQQSNQQQDKNAKKNLLIVHLPIVN